MPHNWLGFMGIEEMWYICDRCHGMIHGKRNALPDALVESNYDGKKLSCEELQALEVMAS